MNTTRFTSSCILMSAALLALPSCRIINGKPDFNWITDQFTPAVDDSVIVDRGVGALDIPATETISSSGTESPIPAPITHAAPQSATAAPLAQSQPQPETAPQQALPAPQQPTVYTVVAGDTLSGIAARHNTKTKVLIELNKLDINKPLQLNQKLLIPATGSIVAPPVSTPPPASEPRKAGFFSGLFGQNAVGEKLPQNITYTVVAGDTLSGIARRHGTRTKTLIELNRLDINKPLQINQKLLIPTTGAAASATPRRTQMQRPPSAPSAPGAEENAEKSLAQPRDTASATEESSAVPQAVTASAETPAPAPANSYTICPGDTLFGIARKLNIPPTELMQINGLTPETADKLRAGATLKLPTPKQP